MDETPRLRGTEKTFVTVTGRNTKKSQTICPEEEIVVWLGAIFEKLSKPGAFVPALLLSTFPTAKAYLKLSENRSFVRYEAYVDRFAVDTVALAETYARQALNKKPEIFGGDKSVDACRKMVLTTVETREKKHMRSWRVTAGLFKVRIFSPGIMYFPFNTFVDPSLLKEGA